MTTINRSLTLTDVQADPLLYQAFMLGFAQGQKTALDNALTINECALEGQVARNTIIAWMDRGDLIYRETLKGFLIYKPSLIAKLVKKGLRKQ